MSLTRTLELQQNTSKRVRLELIQNRAPVNLTGLVAELKIFGMIQPPELEAPLLTLSTVNGRITTVPLTGIMSLNFTAAQTAGLRLPNCYYWLRLTLAGETFVLMEGPVRLILGSP